MSVMMLLRASSETLLKLLKFLKAVMHHKASPEKKLLFSGMVICYLTPGRQGSVSAVVNKLNRTQQKEAEQQLLAQKLEQSALENESKKQRLGDKVTIILPSNETLTISIKDTTTVADLKEIICAETSIATKDMKLSFSGVMKKNNSLVPAGSEIVLQLKK